MVRLPFKQNVSACAHSLVNYIGHVEALQRQGTRMVKCFLGPLAIEINEREHILLSISCQIFHGEFDFNISVASQEYGAGDRTLFVVILQSSSKRKFSRTFERLMSGIFLQI